MPFTAELVNGKLSEDWKGVQLSWGTLNPGHLWEAFRRLLPDNEKWVIENDILLEVFDNEAYNMNEKAFETFHWNLEKAQDYLDKIAPEGTYFGAHVGDGAAFGFWVIEEVAST